MKLRFVRRKKTEQITVETEQIVVIRSQRVIRRWCEQCQFQTEFISLEQINQVLDGVKAGTAGAADPVGGLHFGKALDGSTVVCAESLRRACNLQVPPQRILP